jgi:adenylylsulfate kinase-like enzyme
VVHEPDPRAVLLTRVYGSGKSSVAAEIADILEKDSRPYAAIDLDWLTWFQAPDHDAHADQRMLVANLRALVDNYLGAGVRWFILAGAIGTRAQADEIKAAVPAPMTVVRLTVPLDEIERRLRPDVTTGRQDDLREAAAWLADSVGFGFEDLTMDNDRPIREVALDILERIGWRG